MMGGFGKDMGNGWWYGVRGAVVIARWLMLHGGEAACPILGVRLQFIMISFEKQIDSSDLRNKVATGEIDKLGVRVSRLKGRGNIRHIGQIIRVNQR